MVEKKLYEARKALVIDGNKILLLKLNISKLQLGYDPSLGAWEIPGGRIKGGESDEKTIKREVMEETGIDVNVERELNTFEFSPRQDVTIHCKSFLCRPLSKEVILNDPEQQHESFAWVPLKEALNYDIPKWLKDDINSLM